MITYGEYYGNERNLPLPVLIDDMIVNTMDRIQVKHTQDQCNRLERYLNQLFYPEKYGADTAKIKQQAQALSKVIRQAYETEYNAALNNFGMGSNEITKTPLEVISLARSAHDTFVNKEYIYKSTIQARLKNVEEMLESVGGLNELEKIDLVLKNKVAELYGLLSQLAQIQSGGKIIKFDEVDDNVIQQILRANELYKELSASTGVFSPQDYGQILEWALEAASADVERDGENILDQLVEEEILNTKSLNKVVNPSGATKIQGGGINLSVDMKDIQKKYVNKGNGISSFEKNENNQKTTYYKIEDKKGSFEFKFTSGFKVDQKGKYQKMDVNFILNDGKGDAVPFRITAKNWASDGDFGETSLIAAMLRHFGSDDFALQYAFIMQDEGASTNILEDAHQKAKLAAFLDILMGYSQQEGYADTIVINRRSAQEVKVYSIHQIVKNIQKKLNIPLSGYNDGEIHTNLIILSNSLSNLSGKSEAYKSLSFKYLQSIKLTIYHNQLFKDVVSW